MTMKVTKQELTDRLRGKRGVYTRVFIDSLYQDFADFGWAVFDENALKEKLDRLEANIRDDITTSPEVWVRRFKKEIWLEEM